MYISIPVGQKTNSDAILQEQIPLFFFISVLETGSPIDLEFTRYVRLVVHQDPERPCLRGAGIVSAYHHKVLLFLCGFLARL